MQDIETFQKELDMLVKKGIRYTIPEHFDGMSLSLQVDIGGIDVTEDKITIHAHVLADLPDGDMKEAIREGVREQVRFLMLEDYPFLNPESTVVEVHI